MSNVVELKQNAPVIGDVSITVDGYSRYNLNSLHKASGAGRHKSPGEWLRNKQTQELVQELIDTEISVSPVDTVKGGKAQGTFAHEILAVSYAGWISPAFQVKVNRVFIDYRTGKLEAVDDSPELLMARALKAADGMIQEKNRLIEQQKASLDAAEPKVRFHDRVAIMPDDISVSEAAKIIGTGQKRLFSYLRHVGWLTRRNEPYQAKIEQGLMDVKIGTWFHPEQGFQRSLSARITGKGLIKLQEMWDADHPDGWELPEGTRSERLDFGDGKGGNVH